MTEKYSREYIINEAGVERHSKKVERFWSLVIVVLFLVMIWAALTWNNSDHRPDPCDNITDPGTAQSLGCF